MTRLENRASRTKVLPGSAGSLRSCWKLRLPDGEEAGPIDRRLHRGCRRGSLVEVSCIAQRQEWRREAANRFPHAIDTLRPPSLQGGTERGRAHEHREASRSVHPVERVGGDQDRPLDCHHRVRLPQAEEERAPSRLQHDRPIRAGILKSTLDRVAASVAETDRRHEQRDKRLASVDDESPVSRPPQVGVSDIEDVVSHERSDTVDHIRPSNHPITLSLGAAPESGA